MKHYLLLALIAAPLFSFCQQVIAQGERAPQTNENGDPINNAIDPNGSRQGVWYYEDHSGELLLIENYLDNQLTDSKLAVTINGIPTVLEQNQWTFVNSTTVGLSPSALGYSAQPDKQLGIVVTHTGILKTAFIGNWSQEELLEKTVSLENWFETHSIPFNQNYPYAFLLVQ